MIADVPNINGPATDLPQLTPYKIIAPPKAMCVQKMEWTATSLEEGKDYNGKVNCGNFTCSVDFKINKLDTTNKEYWFLYTDTGYYIVADGNNIYYYEQFCTFYKCYLTSGCLSSSEQMKDDTGSTVFDYITVSGTFLDKESVQFVMASDGVGNVYKDINEKIEISTDLDGKTTAATTPNFNDVLINLSIIGRKYSLDGKTHQNENDA